MSEQIFGGSWTEIKLGALRNYLNAYRNIFNKNPRAQFFTTWYVDAFAGTGTRSNPEFKTITTEDDEADESQTRAYFDGSATIALGLSSPFDQYLFIEKSKARADQLQEMINSDFGFLSSRCTLLRSDANDALAAWFAERDWSKERAVVFLDPFGMQVDWETIALLGRSKAVDLWYLFPLSVVRMLTKSGQIDQSWQDRLDLLFGSPDWREHFYRIESVTNLFGTDEVLRRDAKVETVLNYLESRLRLAFTAVAPSLVLRNTRSSPLFALCFAAANERGAPTALKIAKSILGGGKEKK